MNLVTSALIEAGAADFIYRDDDPTAVETSDSGEILDGDLEPAVRVSNVSGAASWRQWFYFQRPARG